MNYYDNFYEGLNDNRNLLYRQIDTVSAMNKLLSTICSEIHNLKNYMINAKGDNSYIIKKQLSDIIKELEDYESKIQNIIKINDREQDVLSGSIEKDGIYYVPITAMKRIYEVDIEYIANKQILLVDSLTKKLIKADVSKRCSVKYQTTGFSKTVDKLEKADKVVVIEHLENNWTKIRTRNGKIGYIKTNVLQNEIHIRDDINL